MTGKRKRETQVLARSEEVWSPNTAQTDGSAVFRLNFESIFEPLEELSTSADDFRENDQDLTMASEAESLSDWEGLSEDEPPQAVEIINFCALTGGADSVNELLQAKEFMGSKPPVIHDSMSTPNIRQKHDPDTSEETGAEAMNLQHDLELQRFLKESHLLDTSSGPVPGHALRHKAIDLRMQSLGAKTSLFTQKKMPPSHRRGIIAKASLKEATRRREARENGIVLEKEGKARSGKSVKRDRGIGAPTVGKFRGGTLKLSRKDISDILGRPRNERVSGRQRRR